MHRIAGGEQVRATLQLPSLVKGRAALEATIDQFRHGLMAHILRDATVVGPVDTYGQVRAEWLQWDEGSISSCPWLALGDALLTTPPRMGEGLAHILRQVQLIKQCFADGEPHYSLPRTLLADYAKQAWLKATVLETVNDVLSAKS